jgi:hypothetical protein
MLHLWSLPALSLSLSVANIVFASIDRRLDMGTFGRPELVSFYGCCQECYRMRSSEKVVGDITAGLWRIEGYVGGVLFCLVFGL